MKRHTNPQNKLVGLKNIGPTIAKRLNEIGVYNLDDLQVLGPAQAYKKIKANYPNKTISVCYYLYSFEGALLNMHWDDLPEDRKKELLDEVAK